MANPVSKLGWKALTLAIGIPIGIAVKKGVERAWVAVRPNSPRSKGTAKDPNADWKDAVGWAALSAAGVAVAQVVTTKGAAKVWRTLIGSEPPPAAKAAKTPGKRAADASPPTDETP